jgi:hypothetical protein
MNHRKTFLFLLIIMPAFAWSESVGFTFSSGVDLPYDPVGLISTASYYGGGGAALSADYELPFAPPFFLQALVGFDVLQIKGLPGSSTDVLAVGPGGGISLRLASRLQVKVAVDAGYALASYNEVWSSSYFVMATTLLLISLNPSFSFGVGASYKYYSALYSGVGIFIALSSQVKIEDM